MMSLRRIYFIISGRCGNQMFQYAFARALQLKYGGELYLDFTRYDFSEKEVNNGFINYLNIFNTSNYQYIERGNFDITYIGKKKYYIYVYMSKCYDWLLRHLGAKRTQIVTYLVERLISIFLQIVFGVYYIESCNSKWFITPPFFRKSFVVKGYFETSSLWREYSDIIRKELTPKDSLTLRVRELRDIISSCDTICVTVRRGDFLSSAHNERFNVCTREYYEKGVQIIKKKYPNVRILVASDDINWCRENLRFGNSEMIFEPEGLNIAEKLSIMSACNNFVLSNSSFSWWAQFLSENKKNVIAPSKWRNDFFTPKDIYERDWIII